MKKALLITGILIIVACVIILLYAALNYYGYRHVLDGTAELYDRLHRKANVCFALGAVFALIGTLCIVFHSKI